MGEEVPPLGRETVFNIDTTVETSYNAKRKRRPIDKARRHTLAIVRPITLEKEALPMKKIEVCIGKVIPEKPQKSGSQASPRRKFETMPLPSRTSRRLSNPFKLARKFSTLNPKNLTAAVSTRRNSVAYDLHTMRGDGSTPPRIVKNKTPRATSDQTIRTMMEEIRRLRLEFDARRCFHKTELALNFKYENEQAPKSHQINNYGAPPIPGTTAVATAITALVKPCGTYYDTGHYNGLKHSTGPRKRSATFRINPKANAVQKLMSE